MPKINSLEYFKKKFPKDHESAKLLASYCKRINIEPPIEKIEKEHLEKLFKNLMADYLSFKIDPDQLAVLFEKIYLLIQNDESLLNTEIGNNLIEFAELEVQLRTNPKRASYTLGKMIKLFGTLGNNNQGQLVQGN